MLENFGVLVFGGISKVLGIYGICGIVEIVDKKSVFCLEGLLFKVDCFGYYWRYRNTFW